MITLTEEAPLDQKSIPKIVILCFRCMAEMVLLPNLSCKHFMHNMFCWIHLRLNCSYELFNMEMQYHHLGRTTFSSSSLAKCQIRYSHLESDNAFHHYMLEYRLSKVGMCYIFLQYDWQIFLNRTTIDSNKGFLYLLI